MVDWLTLVFTIIIPIFILIGNIYILAYYCHSDEKSSFMGIVMKIIVVFGLLLAWAQVFMWPWDVSNNRSFGGGLNMQLFWYIVFITSAAYLLLIFPITSALYETDEDWTFCEKIRHSFCCFLVTLFCLSVLTLILYFTIGASHIPVSTMYCPLTSIQNAEEELIQAVNCVWDEDRKIDWDVSFIIYIISVMSFISWFIFAIFGGIGIAAVPLDFFYDFCTRPKSMKTTDLIARKEEWIQNMDDWIKVGKEVRTMEDKGYHKKFIFSSDRREYNRKHHEFMAGMLLAENEYYIVNIAEEIKKREIVFEYAISFEYHSVS